MKCHLLPYKLDSSYQKCRKYRSAMCRYRYRSNNTTAIHIYYTTMLLTTCLKRNPQASLIRLSVGAATIKSTKFQSAIRHQRYCHPVFTAVCARSFSDNKTSELVHTELNLDLGIAEITMQNGSVNSLSLEM